MDVHVSRGSAEGAGELMTDYEEHEPCRQALYRAYTKMAEWVRIKEIIMQDDQGKHQYLNVVRIDAFEDGLRVLVSK